MVKRPARGSFAGAHVFPGGVVDRADASAEIYALCDGLDDAEASRRLKLENDGLAYYVAAIRETFEESGYLLARDERGSPVSADVLGERARHWRERLSSGQASLLEMCREFALRPAVDKLAYPSFWLTPRSQKHRYATRFFLADVPGDQSGRHDGAELVDSFWTTPSAALKAHSGLLLPPPTEAQLRALQPYESADRAMDAARARKAADIPCVFGQVSTDDDGRIHFRYADFPTSPEPVVFAGAPA